MANKRPEIWLVGGGTGGHVMPLLALVPELEKRYRLRFIGEHKGKEASWVRPYGIPYHGVRAGKLRRYLTLSAAWLNVRDVFRSVAGLIQAWRLMSRHRPSLILTKGGYVTLPVATVAKWRGIPVVVHESDAVLGATNRYIARFASKVLTAFPATVYPANLASKIIHVGLPLRPEFCTPVKNTRKTRPMILVTGGSQGALGINELIVRALPKLLEKYDIMHITGAFSYTFCKEAKAALPKVLQDRYGVIDFTPDIADYEREATLIVGRASSQIFEFATLGKPMILVPLPTAANNHQFKNAEYFVQQNAAIMLVQQNLTPDRLYETIHSVMTNPAQLRALQEGTRVFACCDSAKRTAAVLNDLLEEA